MSDSLLAVGERIWREAGAPPIEPLPPIMPIAREFAATDVDNKDMRVAAPHTPELLMILAHELGHIVTTPSSDAYDRAPVQSEFNATEWGIKALRRAGFEPTKAMQTAARKALHTYTHRFGLKGDETPPLLNFLKGGEL